MGGRSVVGVVAVVQPSVVCPQGILPSQLQTGRFKLRDILVMESLESLHKVIYGVLFSPVGNLVHLVEEW